MPVFEYTARNLKGELVKDKVDLATRDDVIAHLRKNRMVVVQVRESKGKGGGLGDFFKAGSSVCSCHRTSDAEGFLSERCSCGLSNPTPLDFSSICTEYKG